MSGLRNDNEIWDELRYWLANPITKEEQVVRDKEINSYVNYVIENMFKD